MTVETLHVADADPDVDGSGPAGRPGTEPCKAFYRSMVGGVAVISSDSEQGPVAMTASSVMPVSLTPPLLVVSLANQSLTLAAIRVSGRFAVNLLAEDQQPVAERFSSRRPAWARLAGVDLGQTRPVVLTGALAAAICDVEWMRETGDHTLVLGEIARTTGGSGSPLAWHGSGYHRLLRR